MKEDVLKQEYIEGKLYKSTSHGLVTYKGLDCYHGQTSMKFHSPEYGMQYWLPEALHWHFEEEKEEAEIKL
jgi:hypothetical protein